MAVDTGGLIPLFSDAEVLFTSGRRTQNNPHHKPQMTGLASILWGHLLHFRKIMWYRFSFYKRHMKSLQDRRNTITA